MFVDELTIEAKAGDGGPGVVRWLRVKYKPEGGPAGGNGGKGGDVYLRAVKDLALLAKYTGSKRFDAENGVSGNARSQHGHDGEDLYINIPVGATVTDVEHQRTYQLEEVGQEIKVLKGGSGGLGNEYFKSSTNRSPEQSTPGKPGESATLHIELALIVDIGLIGFPNAGKSTLLNTLTNAKAAIGSYPFTTIEPHLGDCFGLIIADIPGLIEGAADGKGLGHKFLRHVQKTKALLHLISLESEDVLADYNTIRGELEKYDKALGEKQEWVVLTKSDLVEEDAITAAKKIFADMKKPVYVISADTGVGVKELQDALTQEFK